MKKNIIKIVMLFAMFVSVNVFAQSTSKIVLVQTTALSQRGELNKLTNGKVTGFSKEDKAYIVTPNNDDKATLVKLEAELKALLPSASVNIRKKD